MKNYKKTGLCLLGAGMGSLFLSLLLLFTTESIFSTIFFYLSFILNIAGLYILLWKRGKEK